MRMIAVLAGICLGAAMGWGQPAPCTFSCSFNGTTTPEQATGSGMSMPQHEVFVPGRTGQALLVREPGDAVYFLASGNLPKDKGAVSFWVQPQWQPGDKTDQGFFGDEAERAKVGENTIWIWKYGQSIRFDVRDPKDSYITTGIAAWQPGEWHHLVANWDCEQGNELYVDGVQVGSRECTWVPRNGLRFVVGTRQRTAQGANAAFADLAIYARPLTAAEVELAMNDKLATAPAPRPAAAEMVRSTPKLIFQVPFDGTCTPSLAGGEAAPVAQDKVDFVPGIAGSAAVFGSDSRLTFSRPGNLRQETGTIAFWYKPSWRPGVPGKEVWRCCFQEGPRPENRHGSNQIWLWFWGDRVRFDVSDTKDTYIRESLAAWNPDRWHHFAATWDCKAGTRLYIDGEPVGVASDGSSALVPTTWTPFDTFTVFHVGCADGGQGADGAIDDFRIYDGALDAAAVQAEYAHVFRLAAEFTKPGPAYIRVGKTAKIAWRLRLAGSEAYAGKAQWRLVDPAGNPTGQQGMVDLKLNGNDVAEQVLPFAPTIPGTYAIEVSCPIPGGTWAERLVCEAIPPEPAGPRSDTLQTELLERIDLTADLPADRFAQEGESQVVDSPLGRYREAAAAQRSRFAVRATLPEADTAYLLEVDYPDDKPRTMEILAQPAGNAGGNYELQSGVYCGDEYPLSKRMLTHRCVFWARSTDMAFLFMTAEADRPAAVAQLRLYRLKERLPNRLGPSVPGAERHVGIYYEDPALCYDFGGHDTMPDFAKTIDRLMDYMEWSGQDLFMYPGVWYHGPLYPSRSQRVAMSRNHPANFIGYLLTRFADRGLSFIPTLNVHDLSTLTEYRCTEAMLMAGDLPGSPLMVYQDGMPNLGGWHGTPPNYNPLHPVARKAILDMIDEMAELYGDSPAFKGVCFHLPMHVMLWFGHGSAGYNDYCIEAFQKATGIAIPVAADDPSRVRKRAQWLKANAWEPWIAWRCQAIHDLYAEVAAHLTAKRPDLKLIVNTFRPSITDCKTDADYMTPGYCVRVNREAGLDPALFVGDSAIVIDQTIYPADYRWSRAHGRPDRLDQVRQRHFQAETFSVLDGQPNAWVHMHDRYWEDAIGRSKPLESDWLKEVGWRVSTLNPTPPQFLQHYLAPLRFGDVQTITKGGFLIGTLGDEDQLAAFSRAFRALPAVPFADLASQGDIRVRSAVHDGTLYFYAANTGNEISPVRLQFTGNMTSLVNLGTDEVSPPISSMETFMLPYTLLAYRVEGEGVRVEAR